MCPSTCEKCRRCNPESKPFFDKAFETLRKIIPSPVSYNIPPPVSRSSAPSASDAAPAECWKAPAARWKRRNKKPEEPLDTYVNENDEEVTAGVINKLLAVFDPEFSIQRGRAADGRDDLEKHLYSLQKRYEIDTEVIGGMYREASKRPVISGIPPYTLPDKARASRADRSSSEYYDTTDIHDIDPSQEHSSDEEVPYIGKHENNRRTDLPVTCDWGGPERGDDKDTHFLKDDRTSPHDRTSSSTSRSRSPRVEASPERGRSRTRRPPVILKKKGKQKGERDTSPKGKGKQGGNGCRQRHQTSR